MALLRWPLGVPAEIAREAEQLSAIIGAAHDERDPMATSPAYPTPEPTARAPVPTVSSEGTGAGDRRSADHGVDREWSAPA